MRPPGARVLLREQRHAWRGLRTGRRATHKPATTYGRASRERDRLAAWAALDAEWERMATQAETNLAAAGTAIEAITAGRTS